MRSFVDYGKVGLRQFKRAPGYVTTVIVMVALGVGVNTAVFSMLNAFLLRPLPYSEPERLGSLVLRATAASDHGGGTTEGNAGADGQAWQLVRDDVPAVIPAASSSTADVNLHAGRVSQYVRQQRVTAHFFQVLGTQPMLGRSFTETEDTPGGGRVAVLSYRLWQIAYNSDPAVIGKLALLKGEPFTVVGVMPAALQAKDIDIWTPLRPTTTGEGGGQNYTVTLRLKPGAIWQQADAQLAALHPDFLRFYERSFPGRTFHLAAMPLQKLLALDERAPVLTLMSAGSIILLIVCANLAGLTLVRVAQRRGEMATRLALGASRSTLLRQLWMESLVLTVAGGVLGIGIASLALRAVGAIAPPSMIPLGGLGLDMRVLGFTAGAILLTSLLIGALPALATRRVDIRQAMANGSQRTVAGSGSRLRTALIAGEIAMTVVLLACAGLLLRVLLRFETMPPGFDPSHVITAKLSLDDARYRDAAAFRKLVEQTTAAMERIPGVESAAVGLSLPYERGLNDNAKLLDGMHIGFNHISAAAYVTPGYFKTLGIPLLAGRFLLPSDTAETERVVVVNVSFARHFMRETNLNNAVGMHVGSGADHYRVVGVVGDVLKQPGFDKIAPLQSEPTFYFPATQVDSQSLSLVHQWFQPSWIVRTHGAVAGVTQQMQAALASVDPNLPFAGFSSMSELRQGALLQQRVEVMLLGTAAGLALLLSAIGIYGLISSLVVQRTREIGIRMALGSSLQRAMLTVGSAGIVATSAGLGIGLCLTVFAVRLLRSVLYGVSAYDAWTFATVLAALSIVALLSTTLPALRVARIDPARTLRDE